MTAERASYVRTACTFSLHQHKHSRTKQRKMGERNGIVWIVNEFIFVGVAGKELVLLALRLGHRRQTRGMHYILMCSCALVIYGAFVMFTPSHSRTIYSSASLAFALSALFATQQIFGEPVDIVRHSYSVLSAKNLKQCCFSEAQDLLSLECR